MEPDEEPLPFVSFSPKGKCCWCTQNYLWDKSENIIAIRTCVNWFKQFKNNNFDIIDEELSGRFAATEENKLRKNKKKSKRKRV